VDIREFFGLDLEEALQKAAARLRQPVEALRYRRIPGEFGTSLKLPRVGICVEYEDAAGAAAGPAPGDEVFERLETMRERPDECARLILETLLDHLGMPGEVEQNPDSASGHVALTVHFRGEAPDFRRGEYRELRSSIQYLVNRMVNDCLCQTRATGERRYIVDFAGNLEARAAELGALSRRLAEQVRRTGRTLNVHLMESQDRRLLHLALQEDPDVVTSSRGEGRFRVLCVQPRKAGQAARQEASEP
jgi:spoIIIJ-associated protein